LWLRQRWSLDGGRQQQRCDKPELAKPADERLPNTRPSHRLHQDISAPSRAKACAAEQKSGGIARAAIPSVVRNQQGGHIMHFRIRGLPAEDFAPLFALSDMELKAHGAVRRKADGPRPCRISLTDAELGQELILVNYEHHPVASPYRMRFAVFVRKDEQTFDEVDTVPEQLRKRTLAVRSFDADAMMVSYELTEGAHLEGAIERLFADPRAAYLHVHFAAPGCYAARIERA
jgi:hypothetical protein